jgi:hypothetical protein
MQYLVKSKFFCQYVLPLLPGYGQTNAKVTLDADMEHMILVLFTYTGLKNIVGGFPWLVKFQEATPQNSGQLYRKTDVFRFN